MSTGGRKKGKWRTGTCQQDNSPQPTSPHHTKQMTKTLSGKSQVSWAL